MEEVESRTVDVTLEASTNGVTALIDSREASKHGASAADVEFAATHEICSKNASVGAIATLDGTENSAKK